MFQHATVYICGRRNEVLRETEAELARVAKARIHSLPCDVRNTHAVEEMIETIWKDGPLDVLLRLALCRFPPASARTY